MKKVLGFVAAMLLGAAITLTIQAAPPHPEMHRARNTLVSAKRDLEHAAHDYAGHRVKAIEHIDRAIEEVDKGLASVR